jgi:PAS domain S-box-containing protein
MHDAAPGERLELYGALCDSLQDLVFLLDTDGTVFHVNDRFSEVTAVPVEEAVGRHYTDLDEFVSDDSLETIREPIEAVLSGESTERRVDLPVETAVVSGAVVDARITRFETTDLEGVVVALRNFTERVEESEALATRSEQLAVVNRVLRHDVRNDMNVMLGWSEQLADHVDEAGQAILDRIIRHGEHVVELTHAARRLEAAIEADWEMEVEPVALGATLTRSIESVREQFPDATVSPPALTPDVSVQANEFLGSVFGNLLTNAVRHNDAAHPTVTVSVEAPDDASTVRVAVADDGPGIPDVQKEAVYEMGTKGPDSPGTGLGLYLVHSLVTAYGGDITIADNEPRGTVVTVELDRAAP